MNTPRKRQFVDLCVQKQEELAKAQPAKAKPAKVRLNRQRPTNKSQADKGHNPAKAN